jgi:hypothetical protein
MGIAASIPIIEQASLAVTNRLIRLHDSGFDYTTIVEMVVILFEQRIPLAVFCGYTLSLSST